MYVAVKLDAILDFIDILSVLVLNTHHKRLPWPLKPHVGNQNHMSIPTSSKVMTHPRLYMAVILFAILDFDFLRILLFKTHQKLISWPRKLYIRHQNHISMSNSSKVNRPT